MSQTQHSRSPRAKTLIVGLGKTGVSCARYLAARGERVAITDSRAAPPGLDVMRDALPDIALFLGGFDHSVFAQAERLIVSPGVALATPEIQAARSRGAAVLGDIDLFAEALRARPTPVAAITGSNGKSTVTTLVERMAKASGVDAEAGGNLGKPALDLLTHRRQLYVLELSSFQLETMSELSPDVASVLNVSPDHMDRYPSSAAYAQAKARILSHARGAVLNADDAVVSAMPGGGERHWFTLGTPRDETGFGLREFAGETWICRGVARWVPARALRLAGRHNLANALAALAIGTFLGFEQRAMLGALRRFRGLPHRTEWVADSNGVTWFNDSKGTNVGASAAALEGLDPQDGSKTVPILGGACKGAEFRPLAPLVARLARAVILLGRDVAMIELALRDSVPLLKARDMDEAVALAQALAEPGDRVLLSPGCASFDMFRDYEARGEAFRAAVRRRLSP
jgi:UDP-N-acetylmuramoylalanine--D-glutamate ligase